MIMIYLEQNINLPKIFYYVIKRNIFFLRKKKSCYETYIFVFKLHKRISRDKHFKRTSSFNILTYTHLIYYYFIPAYCI